MRKVSFWSLKNYDFTFKKSNVPKEIQAGIDDALINKELETEIRTLAEKTKPQSTIKKINAIMDARTNLSHNAAPLLTVEALMCVLAR